MVSNLTTLDVLETQRHVILLKVTANSELDNRNQNAWIMALWKYIMIYDIDLSNVILTHKINTTE